MIKCPFKKNKGTDNTKENRENPEDKFDKFTKKYCYVKIKESSQRELRSVIYSQILHTFRNNIQNQSEQKHDLKYMFYESAMDILAGTFVLFICVILLTPAYLCICYSLDPQSFPDFMVTGIISIIATAVSAMTAFIKIPQIIAKYLFNKDEDIYMASIVKQIQDYDNHTFQNEISRDIMKKHAEDSSEANPDDDIRDAPTNEPNLTDIIQSEEPYNLDELDDYEINELADGYIETTDDNDYTEI